MAEAERVAVFFAPGFEEIEGLSVVDLLRRAHITCDMISITSDTFVVGSHNIRLICDSCIDDPDFNFDDYSLLVLPGGVPGTPNLAACQPLCDELVRRAEDGRMLAAICAAPTVFAKLGLLKDRKACCYPGMEDELVAGGAEPVFENCAVDGPFITARGMGCAIDFALAIVTELRSADEAASLAASIVYTR